MIWYACDLSVEENWGAFCMDSWNAVAFLLLGDPVNTGQDCSDNVLYVRKERKNECEMTFEACGMEKCCSCTPVIFLDILSPVFDSVVVVFAKKETLFYKGTLSTKCIRVTAGGSDCVGFYLVCLIHCSHRVQWWNSQPYCARAVLANVLQILGALSSYRTLYPSNTSS